MPVTTARFQPGDLITNRAGTRLFRVVKVAQVNYKLTDEDGKGYNLRIDGAHRSGYKLAPEGALLAENPAIAEAQAVTYHLGDVVEFTNKPSAVWDGKWVVLANIGPDKVRVARLNGGTDEYARARKAVIRKCAP